MRVRSDTSLDGVPNHPTFQNILEGDTETALQGCCRTSSFWCRGHGFYSQYFTVLFVCQAACLKEKKKYQFQGRCKDSNVTDYMNRFAETFCQQIQMIAQQIQALTLQVQKSGQEIKQATASLVQRIKTG